MPGARGPSHSRRRSKGMMRSASGWPVRTRATLEWTRTWTSGGGRAALRELSRGVVRSASPTRLSIRTRRRRGGTGSGAPTFGRRLRRQRRAEATRASASFAHNSRRLCQTIGRRTIAERIRAGVLTCWPEAPSNRPMLKSMTGFGAGRARVGDEEFSVELRSLNHKFCEVKARLPRELAALESVVAKQVKDRLARGSVEVFIKRQTATAAGTVPVVDVALAREYARAFREVAEALGVHAEVSW